MYLPLGTIANKQGRVAGENAAGGNAKFRGIAGSAIIKEFDLFVGKTGLTSEEALREGFDPVEEMIESITRAGYWLLGSIHKLNALRSTILTLTGTSMFDILAMFGNPIVTSLAVPLIVVDVK